MQVADLFGLLGIKIDKVSWDRANKAIGGMGKSLGGLMQKAQSWGGSLTGTLARLTAGYGFGKLVETGLKFNANMEDTKNQIAGMMALATKTDLNDNLGKAGTLLDHLRERAAKLPGTTAEYAQMLGMLTQPILDAKLSMQDLEDLTVNSVVGAKALGVEWSAAARDIDQALRGSFHSTDVFTGKLLGSLGFKGEEGRARFNQLSAKDRAQTLKRALTQKQLTQLAAAQGQTASGKFSTLVDTAQQTLGRVMAPLFAKLVGYLEQVNQWLDKNSAKVAQFAGTIGGVLVTALEQIVEAIKFLAENPELAAGLGVILGVFLAMSSPITMIVIAVIALVKIVKALGPAFVAVKNAAADALGWIDDQLVALGGAIVNLGETIAAPFIAAWDAVKAAFDAVYNWIRDKLSWVEGKIGWLVGKAGTIAGFVGGGVGLAAPAIVGAAPAIPTIPAPAGGATTTNNTQVSVGDIHVNAPDVSDPAKVAQIVRSEFRQTMSDAYAAARGGRR